MTHGLGKLERLFSGSRRKGTGRQRAAKQQKESTITTGRSSPPMFPSPPYLRPTSTHMTPRSAQIDGPECEKDRSQSVPTLQEVLYKRSSASSSITIVDRPSRSDISTPSLRRKSRSSQTASRPFRFRFPEDSLFRKNRPINTSPDSGNDDVSREQSPRSRAVEPQGLLDWSPKHISLLFDPLEFEAPSTDGPLEQGSNGGKSTLLPSPDFIPSKLLPASHRPVRPPGQSTRPRPSSVLPRSASERLISHPRDQSLSSHRKSLIYFPSASADKNRDKRKPTIHRSMSLNIMARPCLNSTHVTSIQHYAKNSNRNSRCRLSVQEMWSNGLEASGSMGFNLSSNERVAGSNLRKSASTPRLSVTTSQVSRGSVLKEPTFDDFYALSDDDIAESRPASPALTPPKNIRGPYRNSRPPRAQRSQYVTLNPKREEITPPGTPIDCHPLTLAYSPTNHIDTLGALWAAILASKYDFAVLYVLSLWPAGVDSCFDISATTPVSEPRPTKVTAAMKRSASSVKGPQINGRLLAAYGLNEVPSPFEIATDTHLAALNCDRWNEYRNVDARPNDISRGWIRPFYSSCSPVSAPSNVPGGPPNGHRRDRGIVFAAYSKQTSNPLIPMRPSPEQESLLQQLYADAKALVEALIKRSPGSREDAAFF